MVKYNFQTFKQINLPEYFKQMNLCSVWVTKSVLVFQISKCVTVTELDFVFDNKTVREHLKKY